MTDAWLDQKNKSLMNIATHYPAEIAFLHLEDDSVQKHNANYIFQFVDKAIKNADPKNVVRQSRTMHQTTWRSQILYN